MRASVRDNRAQVTDSRESEYRQLVALVKATLNRRPAVTGKLEIERLNLQPLPVECFADYERMVVRVRITRTIEVAASPRAFPHG
jgi:hypothetical protein